MTQIDKTIIQNFAKPYDEQSYLSALGGAVQLVEDALSDIGKYNPHVSSKFQILPVGDFYTGSVLPNSSLDLLLVVDNPQIEINTQKQFKNKWQNFAARLKFAWKNRKKRKKRKKKKQQGKEEAYLDPKTNYSISSLSKDLVNSIAKFITKNDFVQLSSGVIMVQGENISFQIKIFPVMKKEENKFLFYRPGAKKMYEFSLQTYFDNIANLVNTLGQKFAQQVQIFSGLHYFLLGTRPKSSYIESLIANLPKSAFEQDDAYQNFVFAINYLTNTKLSTFFSLANPDKKMLDDEVCGVSVMEINQFLRKLSDNI